MDVAIIRGDLGHDCGDHIVRSISFNHNGIIRVECARMGAWVKAVLRVSNALDWLEPQVNGVFWWVR